MTPGTFLYTNNPAWLLGRDGEQKLLNLGNPEARQWLTDHVDAMLTHEGIDLYRQDSTWTRWPTGGPMMRRTGRVSRRCATSKGISAIRRWPGSVHLL